MSRLYAFAVKVYRNGHCSGSGNELIYFPLFLIGKIDSNLGIRYNPLNVPDNRGSVGSFGPE